jgi:C2H2-type zinc finger/Zinc finger, C2H2 type
MDRKSLVCKYCNQAFIRRDLLELHQKSHFENNSNVQQEAQQQSSLAINSNQPKPIVFYNQPQEQITPMNFYTENTFNAADTGNAALQPQNQPKSDFNSYPIMNQLLSGININQNLAPPVKNFMCGICSNTFFKKKELDRHVITIHTNIQQFKCDSCNKSFNRKDKLLRHEKIHLVPPSIFNCSLCPAVFVRKQMLESHSKIHEVGNGHQAEPLPVMPIFPPAIIESNGFSVDSLEKAEPQELTLEQYGTAANPPSMSNPPAAIFPMNLSMSKDENEPMDLSNEKIDEDVPIMKVEPVANITIDSDDEEVNALHIAEEPFIKKSSSMKDLFNLAPQVSLSSTDLIPEPHYPTPMEEMKPKFEEEFKSVDDLSFPMTSRIAGLDKLEPLRDLPMEILNND